MLEEKATIQDLRSELSQKDEIVEKLEGDLNNLHQKLQTQSQQLAALSSLENDKIKLESICADQRKALETAEEELNKERKTITDLNDLLLAKDNEVQEKISKGNETIKLLQEEVYKAGEALKLKEESLQQLREKVICMIFFS